MWSAELYNCNAFVGDVAKYMGLKVPASTLIYPKIFVTHLRLMNTGHPEAAKTLVSDNVKEMSNPTRDGRAMINNNVYTIGPNGEPEVVAGAGGSAAESHDRHGPGLEQDRKLGRQARSSPKRQTKRASSKI